MASVSHFQNYSTHVLGAFSGHADCRAGRIYTTVSAWQVTPFHSSLKWTRRSSQERRVVWSLRPLPIRSLAGSEGEADDEEYDPNDVAVSDESVPDDVLETLEQESTQGEGEISGSFVSTRELEEGRADESEAEEAEKRRRLKQAVVDSVFGTERGLKASSETRAEVAELITQLEAHNPTAYPTEALSTLSGKWILVYTSFSELYALLAAGSLPLVEVGEISQTIDTDTSTIKNAVEFKGPLSSSTFEATAAFEVRSAKRLQIKFREGVIGAPQVSSGGVEIPTKVEILGEKYDIAALSSALKPLEDVAAQVAATISGQPPLKFQIGSDRAQSWLLTTYLDDDFRISRGDGGGLFVLAKDGSEWLY